MKRFIALAALFALTSGLLLPTSAVAQAVAPDEELVPSSAGGIKIDITVYQPVGASAENKVPVVLFSHGWGGDKTDGDAEAARFNDAGIGYVTITQRGHGNSEGEANVQDPELEAEDIQSVIDYIATLDWVKKDVRTVVDELGNETEVEIANDPVLGAIGGSYGGGYQTMTALDEIAESATPTEPGHTRFNALAPQITWYDLPESLAPQDVIRGTWNAALYGAGKAQATLPPFIDEAFAFGTATGQWPDGKLLGGDSPVPIPDVDTIFHAHSPVSFADQGVKLNIPVLFRQGLSDNLFNLNQGLNNFNKALTPEAQSHSILVGFNGGHALPNVLPLGAPIAAELGGGVDACSTTDSTTDTISDWNTLELAFFQAAFAGEETGDLLGGTRYNLTDLDGVTCHRFDAPTSILPIEPTKELDPTSSSGMISTVGAGAPINIPLGVTAGTTIAGVATLSGNAYAAPVDTRVFFGLSVGTTPADAQVVQNNLMPLHFEQPAIDQGFNIELAGVAVTVPEGKELFLTITPLSDMFFGSRTPGGMVITDLEVKLPIL